MSHTHLIESHAPFLLLVTLLCKLAEISVAWHAIHVRGWRLGIVMANESESSSQSKAG